LDQPLCIFQIVVEFEVENEDLERYEIFGDHQYDPEVDVVGGGGNLF
jgi:hypothetical protein